MLEEKVERLLEQYRQEMIESYKETMDVVSVGGEQPLKVNRINLALSMVCNCYCIMCPAFSKDHKPEPKLLTLEKLKKILPDKLQDDKITFSLINGESLLNPEIYEILKYIKEKFKKSEIVLLTNGTIPPENPEIVKYIDNLGFSVDGGTKEVYEKIRTPAKFDHVVEVIMKWVEARNKYNPKLLLSTSTTLSALNLEDLPNIVKLFGNITEAFGTHWDMIRCQPVVIQEYQDKWLREITLEHVEPEIISKIIKEAQEIAKVHNIQLEFEEAIYGLADKKDKGQTDISEVSDSYKKRFCKRLENGEILYDINGRLDKVCCFMDKKHHKPIYDTYEIPREGKPEELYNSKGYWRLRRDLLQGKLEEPCKDCSIGISDYYIIRDNIKRIVLKDELERLKNLEREQMQHMDKGSS